MKEIGFKNFRRFEEFPAISFAPITIFVGGNNSGKSTVVKAIISVLEYLNTAFIQPRLNSEGKRVMDYKNRFYFNKNFYAHIGTFNRALYNKAKNRNIYFDFTFRDFRFEIKIYGDDKDDNASSGKVTMIEVTYLPLNIIMSFNFEEDVLTIKFNKIDKAYVKYSIEKKEKRLRANKVKIVHFETERIKEWEKRINKYQQSLRTTFEISDKISGENIIFGGPLLYTLSLRVEKVLSDFISKKDSSNDMSISDDCYNFLKKNQEIFPYIEFSRFFLMRESPVEYIYAHAASQMVIYSAKDSNDYLVKTIHEFAERRYPEQSEQHKFICKWMKEFNIGINYKISSISGEAHSVKIIQEDGSYVNLADKGMGSIQLMILLFRLATQFTHRTRANIIIIEEPEQNIHPKLQSKLADLFYHLNKEYGQRFIIETHSEYLIRRSQVLVAEKKYETMEELNENTPFRVYYFPSDNLPYMMQYRTDGKFANDFGSGFFDEATKLAFDIF